MMKFIFGGMILISIVFGILTGNTADVSNAVLEEGVGAIELLLYMLGSMCVWGGVMKVADKAGITDFLCKCFKPLGKLLFKGINFNGRAFKAMCMNVTANLLGLGNAATPFGIEAMKSLEKEENAGDTATDNMIIFTVLNTASITLIPATAAALRLKYGAKDPLDILPAVLLNSLIAVTVALIVTKILNAIRRGK